ncbi:ESAT-6-like protein EsxE [Mycobacterium heckeshornense]|nr:ESAT-6-like protein EsxE [Mycobacterium heckeshornense]
MREALRQLQGAASTAHANYTGAMAKNIGMWS